MASFKNDRIIGAALLLPNTAAPDAVFGPIGSITLNSNSFLHAYGPTDISGNNTNTFVGANAGNYTTTGAFNVGIGTQALAAITTTGGSGGYNASYNVAIGYQPGMAITTGAFNTAIGGYSVLSQLTSGRNNICIGEEAGQPYTSSESNNIILASTGGLGSGTGVLGESNTLRIGNSTSSGIGGLTAAYICGIDGVNLSTANIVTESSNQLGTATITGGTGIAISTAFSNEILISTTGITTLTVTTVLHAASPYTVLSTDAYISCDVTGGVITVKLPNAPSTGRVYYIKDKVGLAGTSNITITTVGGAVTIDGATSQVMNTAYESMSVIFDGTSYEIF